MRGRKDGRDENWRDSHARILAVNSCALTTIFIGVAGFAPFWVGWGRLDSAPIEE